MFMSFQVASDPVITEAAVPSMLHIYNETGQAYVDHLDGYCNTERFTLLPTHEKYESILSILLTA